MSGANAAVGGAGDLPRRPRWLRRQRDRTDRHRRRRCYHDAADGQLLGRRRPSGSAARSFVARLSGVAVASLGGIAPAAPLVVEGLGIPRADGTGCLLARSVTATDGAAARVPAACRRRHVLPAGNRAGERGRRRGFAVTPRAPMTGQRAAGGRPRRTDRLRSIMSRLVWAALVVAASVVALAADQQPIFRSGVRTVPVYATVARRQRPPRARSRTGRFEILDNGKPVTIRRSQRAAAVHGRGDARHEREHDRPPGAAQPGRRAVPAPHAAGGPGAGRRVQRQAAALGDVHQRPRRTHRRARRAPVRQLDPPVGRRRLQPRRAQGRRRPARRAGVHRRRRHRQQGAASARCRIGPATKR